MSRLHIAAVSILLVAPTPSGSVRAAGDPPPAAADSAPVLVLDLDTALQMVVENNLALRRGVLAPEVSRQRVREQSGVFDPVLGASVTRARTSNLDEFTGTPVSTDVRNDEYNASLQGFLPTGATYQAGLSSQNYRGSFNEFADRYNTFLGVSVTQPLLRGFGPKASLAQLRLARSQDEAARWEYRQLVNDTITQATFSFYQLALARGALAASERSVALVEELVADNEKRLAQGAMSQQDVVAARARAARRRESLYFGRQSVAAAENALKRLIFADLSAAPGSRLELRLALDPPPPPEQLAGWAAAALDLRPDFQQARLAVTQRRVELGYERSRQLPSVDLVASYGFNGRGDSFSGSWSQIRDGDYEAYSVGAVVSVPVLNRSGIARRRAAGLELRRAELALMDFEQDIRRQLDDATDGIATAAQRVESTREARTLAEQNLAAEEKLLRAGASSTFLVLEQQEIVTATQLSELQAVADLAMAMADFHRLAGRTVPAFRLESAIAATDPAR